MVQRSGERCRGCVVTDGCMMVAHNGYKFRRSSQELWVNQGRCRCGVVLKWCALGTTAGERHRTPQSVFEALCLLNQINQTLDINLGPTFIRFTHQNVAPPPYWRLQHHYFPQQWMGINQRPPPTPPNNFSVGHVNIVPLIKNEGPYIQNMSLCINNK